MQQRNFVLFMVLSFLLLFGWMWVQEQIWPRKPVQPNEETHKVVELKPPSLRTVTVDQLSQWFINAAPPAGGLETAVRLATATEIVTRNPPTLIAQAKNRQEKQLKIAAASALARLAMILPGTLDARDLVAMKALPPDDGARDIVLGEGQEYYLRAVVNPRGGGIRRLTLPIFQEATEEGRPAYVRDAKGNFVLNEKGKKIRKELDLIPDDPFTSSFLLYHYPDVEKADPPQPTLGTALWKVESNETNAEGRRLVLSFDKIPGFEGVKVIRVYTLKPREYHVGLQVEIVDQRPFDKDAPTLKFQYQMAGSHGMPIEGEWYASVFRTPMIGILDVRGDLWRDLDETQYRISQRKGGEKVRPSDESKGIIQYVGVANQFFTSLIVLDNLQEKDVKLQNIISYARPTLESEEKKGVVGAIRLSPTKAFLDVKSTDPKDPGLWSFELTPRARQQLETSDIKENSEVLVCAYQLPDSRWVGTEVHKGKVPRWQRDDFTIRVVSFPLNLKPGERHVHKYLLYNGPAKVRLLDYFRNEKEDVDAKLVERYANTLHLRTVTDYHSPGWFGSFFQTIRWTDLLIFTTGLMHWLLDKLHMVLPVWGLTIIALTVLVRGLMFPISRKQAMISQRMQALTPEMKALKEKYKGDPQAQQAAVMELYRKHKVNPLGGCLPLILQMPIFLGLYYCLQESIFFRLSGFLWVENLAAPDMLFWWTDKIPWISDPDNLGSFIYLGPYFNLLPIIAVALMMVQQKMLTPPPTTDEQEMQQKMMKYMMVFMGVMFYKVAAGLCIYFIASSLWGLAEKRLLPKAKTAAQPGQPATAAVEDKKTAPPANPRQRRQRERDRGKPRVEEPDTAVQKVKGWWQEVLKQAKKK